MMLQIGDDGVVSSVNEEDLIYVDKKELEQFIESYQKLEKENEQLKQRIKELQKESYGNLDGLNYYQEQNGHLSSKISDLECENEELKQDVEYWKQVASQYSIELNVFEHCKKYKTECKDIYWSSD